MSNNKYSAMFVLSSAEEKNAKMAERFKHVTSSEVDEIINNAVPINTKKATKFAVKIFNEWFSQQTEFSSHLAEMEKQELAKCLEKFYLGARQKDGVYYKSNTLRSIRAGLDRHLQSPELKKPFSIITDPEFLQANKALDAFVKTLRNHGDITGVEHKGVLTREIVEQLFQQGQLGPANSNNPTQLQNTVWFYISLFFGKRGRFSLSENQRKMTKKMLILRTTSCGRQFYEINPSVAGVLPSTQNHRRGIRIDKEWSNAKMVACPGSPRCPVETVKNYFLHLHPMAEFFFQKPRALSGAKFNPAVNQIWYCNSPIGDRSLGEMMKKMTSRAGISPYLTNHSIRTAKVEVLGEEYVEADIIGAVTLSIDNAVKGQESVETHHFRAIPSIYNAVKGQENVEAHHISAVTPSVDNASKGQENVEAHHMRAVTLSIDSNGKVTQMGGSEPVHVWTPQSFELYKKLSLDLMVLGNGDWIEHMDDLTFLHDGEKRLFTKAVISEFPGKFFEYQFFFNKKDQRLKGVVQFGPYTQGPPGCVHQGASVSMMDAAIGVCVNLCYSNWITSSLSVDYKSFLPLGSTALVESKVDKVEEREIFASAELKSPDGKVTYVTASAQFVQLDPQGRAYPSVQVEQNEQMKSSESSNTQTSSDGFSGTSTDTTERKMRVRSTILQQLKELKALKDDGVLTDDEFVSQKEKLLTELNSL